MGRAGPRLWLSKWIVGGGALGDPTAAPRHTAAISRSRFRTPARVCSCDDLDGPRRRSELALGGRCRPAGQEVVLAIASFEIGVAGRLDHLHAIEQRLADRVGLVAVQMNITLDRSTGPRRKLWRVLVLSGSRTSASRRRDRRMSAASLSISSTRTPGSQARPSRRTRSGRRAPMYVAVRGPRPRRAPPSETRAYAASQTRSTCRARSCRRQAARRTAGSGRTCWARAYRRNSRMALDLVRPECSASRIARAAATSAGRQ